MLRRLLLIVCTLVATPLHARANDRIVDVELVLAVDVSGSMDFSELQIQRRGYVEAFRSSEVHAAIEDGLIGAVAVMYVEWARDDLKNVIVPWTRLANADNAIAFAGRLERAGLGNMRNTSISGAINYGVNELEANAYDGMRRVIDISGDGPNNQGGLVTRARDEAVAKGVTINGLPLALAAWQERMIFGDIGIGLADYYRACVIGGPGSFVVPAANWDGFADAVRRKLVLELAGRVPEPDLVVPAQFLDNQLSNVDCLVGEKRRRERERSGP